MRFSTCAYGEQDLKTKEKSSNRVSDITGTMNPTAVAVTHAAKAALASHMKRNARNTHCPNDHVIKPK